MPRNQIKKKNNAVVSVFFYLFLAGILVYSLCGQFIFEKYKTYNFDSDRNVKTAIRYLQLAFLYVHINVQIQFILRISTQPTFTHGCNADSVEVEESLPVSLFHQFVQSTSQLNSDRVEIVRVYRR